MKEYERIDALEEEVKYLQGVIYKHMKHLESILEGYIELLKKYEDVLSKFVFDQDG